MDLHTGQSLWTLLDAHRTARAPVAQPIHRSIRCEVLVVGSGVSGALTAFHLAEQGVDVVVVDRRDLATGSTTASTALIQYDIDTPLIKLRKKIGPHRANAVYRISRQSVADTAQLVQRLQIKCDLARRPSLFLAHSEKDLPMLKAECTARRDIGIEVEFLTGPSLHKHFSIRRSGAILSHVAYQLDPWLFTRELLTAAQKLGARIFSGVKLLPIPGEHLLYQTADGHRIAADHVVWATGYETPQQFPEIKNVCRINSTYVIATRPTRRIWPQKALIWETGDPYLYARTARGNRIIIGGLDEPFANPRKRDALIPAKSQKLLRQFNRLFPIGDVQIETAWAGAFAQTEDGLPCIGQLPAYPGCHFALGYGGNGITFSMIAAQLIRDDILHRPTPAAHYFSFDRLFSGRAKLAASPKTRGPHAHLPL